MCIRSGLSENIHRVIFTLELCKQIKSISHYRPDRAVRHGRRYEEDQAKIHSHRKPNLEAIRQGIVNSGAQRKGMGKKEHPTCEKGKRSWFPQEDETQRHLPCSLATARNGFTERPGFSNILCLHEVICASISLPVGLRSSAALSGSERGKGKRDFVLHLCTESIALNSSEKHTSRGNLVKSLLPFASCSYKNVGFFSPLIYLS